MDTGQAAALEEVIPAEAMGQQEEDGLTRQVFEAINTNYIYILL